MASAGCILGQILEQGLSQKFVWEFHGAHAIGSAEEFSRLIAAIRHDDPDTVGVYSQLKPASCLFTPWERMFLQRIGRG
jgi:hypothetical protein